MFAFEGKNFPLCNVRDTSPAFELCHEASLTLSPSVPWLWWYCLALLALLRRHPTSAVASCWGQWKSQSCAPAVQRGGYAKEERRVSAPGVKQCSKRVQTLREETGPGATVFSSQRHQCNPSSLLTGAAAYSASLPQRSFPKTFARCISAEELCQAFAVKWVFHCVEAVKFWVVTRCCSVAAELSGGRSLWLHPAVLPGESLLILNLFSLNYTFLCGFADNMLCQ